METISKKELLELTGISYGQLYRWKREKLIPEEWFMKQASYTGQETFFPKEQMVGRVKSILALKDDYSLEELSRILEPDTAACIFREDLDLVTEIDKGTLDQILALAEQETFRLVEVAFFILLSQVKKKGEWREEEFAGLAARSLSEVLAWEQGDFSCTFFRTAEQYHMALCKEDGRLKLDAGVTVLATAASGPILSQIKVNYNHLFH